MQISTLKNNTNVFALIMFIHKLTVTNMVLNGFVYFGQLWHT